MNNKIKITVLDCATLGADIDMQPLFLIGDVECYDMTPNELVAERIAQTDVIVLNKVKLNETNLLNATNLKLICVAATGYDNIDTEYCRKRGIAVCNVAGYSSKSVAQLTCAMVLSLSVNLLQFMDFVETGKYTESGLQNCLEPVYHELCGKTWGIIGYGGIGKSVAAVADALGCNVIVNKRTPANDAECVSIEELCARSDIISIHTPLNDGTRNLINKERIALMKKDVILVNTARGAVCDEAAVAEAVLNNQIGGFGCDVYSTEPFSKEHPYNKIMHLKNVYLTPHMAWGAYEARQRCLAEIGKNIEAFFAGEKRNRIV